MSNAAHSGRGWTREPDIGALRLDDFMAMQWQREMKTGARGSGLAFDVTAVVVNDLFDDS